VRGGDVLVAEDGSLIKVIAAPQPVLVITHCSEHGTPFDLMRAAYHLGNRHVPIELKPDHLKIEPDHVLAGMLRSMHLIVREGRGSLRARRRGLWRARWRTWALARRGAGRAGAASGSYAGSPAGHSHDHGHDHSHGHSH
jgi:urease accessory protein